MDLLFFQQYWWTIISLLGALLVFLLFVQGGQTLLYTLGKTETEQTLLINCLGRKWEFTFTTLVTFGGAFFASFPLFYATSFGGAYWIWMCLLFCFMLQAVSYEFRSKPGAFPGKKTYEIFLLLNGFLGTFLLGVIVATFFTGSAFSVNEMNQSHWETRWHGLESIANLQNLALGLTVLFLSRVLACLYFMNSIDHDILFKRARRHLIINAIPFLICFLFFTFRLMTLPGYEYQPGMDTILLTPGKYYQNLTGLPIVGAMFILGTAGVIAGLWIGAIHSGTRGIWYAGAGTILTVWALLLLTGLNHTCFYPSTFDPESSLHIENSSSSLYTLRTMSWISLLIPFVLVYIFIAWRAINRQKISETEMGETHHLY